MYILYIYVGVTTYPYHKPNYNLATLFKKTNPKQSGGGRNDIEQKLVDILFGSVSSSVMIFPSECHSSSFMDQQMPSCGYERSNLIPRRCLDVCEIAWRLSRELATPNNYTAFCCRLEKAETNWLSIKPVLRGKYCRWRIVIIQW